MKIIVLIIIAAGSVYWLAQLYALIRTITRIGFLEDVSENDLSTNPKVSIIIPVRNEEETLEAAIRSRLKDHYPNREMILIDDRSTDRTPDIIKKISSENPCIRSITITSLPEGWLGKPHALMRGLEQATGDWLLFSDADVHTQPGTLKKAITFCEKKQVDHLTVIPELWAKNFILDMIFSGFMRLLCFAGRIWAIEDPRSSAVGGAGAFNLVRRAAYERTKGFTWLKGEIIDDIALGQMLKRSGARSAVINGRHYVGLFFYGSMAQALAPCERITFTMVGKISYLFPFILGCILCILEVSPLVALIPHHAPLFPWFGAGMLLTAWTISIAMNCWLNRRVGAALFFPVHAFIAVYGLCRAGILSYRRKGLLWRGTFYRADTLKKGSRLQW